MNESAYPVVRKRLIHATAGDVLLDGILQLPTNPLAVVLFAHGSGSSRHSPRNRHVAHSLNRADLATLLIDLLTSGEEVIDAHTARFRFRIDLLAERLIAVTDWLGQYPETQRLPVGYFGASTGAAVALIGAAERPNVIAAVVSRGGRPDLAGPALLRIEAPTLLIVGEDDAPVIELNQAAFDMLHCEKELVIVSGATHLFEEPGALEEVARLACVWFRRHLILAE
jgi:pimeloyl-ACP methyl ester carboxylesterase